LGIFDIINVPLGIIFKVIHDVVGSYGWALVVFTFVIKLALLPLTLKQQQGMLRMQKLQPKLQEIQKKYQYDKEKLNQETMKLYKDNNANPMSGCLPLLLQFPILIGLYNIIRNPLTYVMRLASEQVTQIANALGEMGLSVPAANGANFQIDVANTLHQNWDRASAALSEILGGAQPISFDFFGLNLSNTPQTDVYSALLAIPILAGLSTFLLSWLTMKTQPQSAPAATDGAGQMQNSMKMMNYIFPFMTAWFAFTLPAGLGFYWFLSNIFQVAQQLWITNVYNKKRADGGPKPEHFRERQVRKRRKK
jgi:YidC/Oxa1 family membrane protein insertase